MAFSQAVLFTAPGQAMIVMGISVSFVFALPAMMLSAVSLPLLPDRDTGLDTAIATSFRAVVANPDPMALHRRRGPVIGPRHGCEPV